MIPIKGNAALAPQITKENILKPIKLINEVMELNGIKKLVWIAVEALNPHAEFGTEEKEKIPVYASKLPAIIKELQKAKKNKVLKCLNTDGPKDGPDGMKHLLL